MARQEAKDGTVDEVRAPERGLMVRTEDGLRVRSEDVVEREYAIPHNAKLLVENGQMIRAGDADHRRPDQPAGVPRDPRPRGASSATSSRRSSTCTAARA